jgi:hypothetical protein
MNCKRCQKWLYFYREGELSERQAKSLNRHLERCPECAALLDRIGRLEDTVRQARENAPRPGDPEILTGRIMHSITSINTNCHSVRVPASVPSIMRKKSSLGPAEGGSSEESHGGLTSRPGATVYNGRKSGRRWNSSGIRFGLAAAAVAVVSAFFIQESMILSRISRLEGRMAAVSTNQAAAVSLRDAFPVVEGINGIPNVSLTQSVAQEEWVRIKKTDLERLIRIVRKQHPEIRTLDEALSVDQETMLRILRKNSGIVRKLLKSS